MLRASELGVFLKMNLLTHEANVKMYLFRSHLFPNAKSGFSMFRRNIECPRVKLKCAVQTTGPTLVKFRFSAGFPLPNHLCVFCENGEFPESCQPGVPATFLRGRRRRIEELVAVADPDQPAHVPLLRPPPHPHLLRRLAFRQKESDLRTIKTNELTNLW